jgi:phosphatidyl-myo-inositol dimannoside synthase
VVASRILSTIVALVTDAYGGFGGIAQYNRDFLSAMADSPRVGRVVVIPRMMPESIGTVPPAIDYKTSGLSGLGAYGASCSRVLCQERPSLILCGHVNLLPFAVPLAVRFRVPLAMLVYGIDVWSRPRYASRVLLSRVKHIVSISRLTVDKMMQWSDLPSKCPLSIIPNAVDLNRFTRVSEKPQELLDRYGLHGKRVIMTVGRLVARERYKGVREVLDVMPQLLDIEPNIKYLIVGDGSDLANLREQVASLNLTQHAVFAGKVEESEKVAHYQLADAYVMPGRGEGFGFVFLEAMACGIPVVASVLDGSREAVRFGALGELCDPRDSASIISAIGAALAKGRGNPPAGLEYFSMQNFRKRVHALIDSVLSNNATGACAVP